MSLHLKIIAPSKIVLEKPIESLNLPTTRGYVTILDGHADIVIELGTGIMRAREPNAAEYEYFISGGYLDLKSGHIDLLVDVLERAQDIDLKKAEKARQRAEQRIKDVESDFDRASKALERAEHRLSFAGEKKH